MDCRVSVQCTIVNYKLDVFVFRFFKSSCFVVLFCTQWQAFSPCSKSPGTANGISRTLGRTVTPVNCPAGPGSFRCSSYCVEQSVTVSHPRSGGSARMVRTRRALEGPALRLVGTICELGTTTPVSCVTYKSSTWSQSPADCTQ